MVLDHRNVCRIIHADTRLGASDSCWHGIDPRNRATGSASGYERNPSEVVALLQRQRSVQIPHHDLQVTHASALSPTGRENWWRSHPLATTRHSNQTEVSTITNENVA